MPLIETVLEKPHGNPDISVKKNTKRGDEFLQNITKWLWHNRIYQRYEENGIVMFFKQPKRTLF